MEGPSRGFLRNCENFSDGSFAALVQTCGAADGMITRHCSPLTLFSSLKSIAVWNY